MKTIALVLFFIGTSFSMAQEMKTTSTTNFSKNRFLEKIKPDSIAHFSIFNGPTVDLRDTPRESNGDLDNDGLSSWHQVSFRYQLTKKTRFAINPRFVVDYNSPKGNGSDNGFTADLDNPVLGIDTTWYENGNFTWRGSLNTVFWLFDEGDKKDQLLANPGGFQTFAYKLNEKNQFGTWFWLRARLYGNDDEGSNSRLPTFIAPFYNYTLNDKSSITAFYQINGDIVKSNKVTWDDDEHFNLLYAYQINQALTVQPMLTVFRETGFDLTKGNINLWLSGRFF